MSIESRPELDPVIQVIKTRDRAAVLRFKAETMVSTLQRLAVSLMHNNKNSEDIKKEARETLQSIRNHLSEIEKVIS